MATRSKRKTSSKESEVSEVTDNQLDDLFTNSSFVNEPNDDESESEESYFSELEEEISSDEEDDKSEEDDDYRSEDEDDDTSEENSDEASTSADEKTSINQDNKSMKKKTKRKTRQIDSRMEKTKKEYIDSGIENSDPIQDEYEYDSSDEEDIRNTVGNIPMQWYNDYPHIGYDLDGKRISKPAQGDELDEFLNKMENPDYWITVKNKMTGENVVLTDEELDIIERIEKGRYPQVEYDPYEPYVDFFTKETMIHPVTRRPEHKRSFIPSLIEKEKVSRLVHAIRMGWLKPSKKKEEKPQYYMLWDNEDKVDLGKRYQMHIPAPKTKLPGHEESYNPPPEYLPTEEEALAWQQQDPEDRRLNYLPKKFDCLRKVPAYSNFIREQFERCLDLYLCPRQRKMRVQVNPEDLIPKLPKPKELQPFPTVQAIVYKGHSNLIRSISVDPSGQWLASGSDDSTVKLWEVISGRCLKTIPVSGAVHCVAWCPNVLLSLLAIVVDDNVHILNTGLGDKLLISGTDNVIENYEPAEDSTKSSVDWVQAEDDLHDIGFRLSIKHPKVVKQVTWHGRGDYLATVQPQGGNAQVLIHQLSKRRTQNPFNKSKGLVQCVLFHPTRPFFFVATQRFVRVYNLLKQEMTKKLLTNAKWVSSIAVHPGGDNIIVGSYDCRLSWFDMDLSTKPYQTLRHHKKAIRQVTFHKSYPLFASASDDGTVIVCHGTVYSDLMQNPLIVPVKLLRGHELQRDLGVIDCQFHPTQPWLFSSGSDNTVRLYT